jgi:glycosyltransferase involved in cell wall biosynthesis
MIPRLNVVQMVDVTGRGGAEKAMVDLALRLDRRRFAVTVCATRSTGNYQPILDAAGVATFVVGRQTKWDLYKLSRLVRFLRRQPVHILHTHLFGSNTWGRLLGTLAGVPVIIAHEHGSTIARREVWIDRLLYRLSDAILVPSEASKRWLRAQEGVPARLFHVVYNGVDIAQFSRDGAAAEIRAELGIPADVPVIGTVGRLSADKGGQDVLIRAVARLRQAYPAARLVVVGDGALRPKLEQLAARLDLGAAVIFTGVRADVPRLLDAMDMFVLPSLREALPVAVLEAMASARPVVATNVGGVHEVLRDGETGLLVPPGDPAALAAALQRLVSDRALATRLGAAGRARVEAAFTIEQMVRRIEHLYSELARRKLDEAAWKSVHT